MKRTEKRTKINFFVIQSLLLLGFGLLVEGASCEQLV